jgi:hypothetical protein
VINCAYGLYTVAPLQGFHAQSAVHILYYEITLSIVSHTRIYQ